MGDIENSVTDRVSHIQTPIIPARPQCCSIPLHLQTRRRPTSVVVNLPEAGFLAKNQLLLQAPTWIQVPGISHLNPDKPERMLCPVRQLQLYLRDSNSIRGGWQNLFIHWDRNLDDIVSTHIKVDRGGSQTGLQWSRTPVRPDHGTRSASVVHFLGLRQPSGPGRRFSGSFLEIFRSFQNSYLKEMSTVGDGRHTQW